MLRQLAFASRARPGLRASETSELIGSCRADHEREAITGVLLYTGESFLQLVEGRDAAVAALWRRLLDDDRHQALVLLHDAKIPIRSFDSWRAGYVSEQTLARQLVRWRSLAPQLPPSELDALRLLLQEATTF